MRSEFLTVLKINYITEAQRDLMEVFRAEGNRLLYGETIIIGLINHFAMLEIFLHMAVTVTIDDIDHVNAIKLFVIIFPLILHNVHNYFTFVKSLSFVLSHFTR
jgi:hypothetical protein